MIRNRLALSAAGGLLVTMVAFGALIMLPIIVVGGAESNDTTGQQAAAVTGHGLSDKVSAEYRDIVLRAGQICDDVTPAVIAAQIEQESGWRPEATSPAGAQGISQFMPGTWASHGMDGDGDGHVDIWNPADAIWSQGHYMCRLRTSVLALRAEGTISGSTLDLTLAAYNAGLGNVQAAGGVPRFAETTRYISRIHALIPTYQAPTAAAGSGQEAVVEAGRPYLGRPYRGEGAGGMDCCTFVQTAVRDALGITLPMYTPGHPLATAKCEASMMRAEAYGGQQIPLADARPGDLVFFQSAAVSPSIDFVTHVGIYMGDGQVMDSSPGRGVAITDLSRYATSDPILDIAVRLPTN
ncbi:MULTISPECIES: lytic murein transglycosylase [unclassified Actinobaculum]|uniref:C40 family peptidase n=1 Tax=unclassified Actinobaculum TaxID=2609299 RepID=UPI000D52951E|nr:MULTISPECIES: lytic murein transglycosylase [unclassified Actinobaculum]AWE42851.1 hypothetical protein DDD63_08975 [Actinobaculum sp. 313]RTE49069.1 hypothetical protein EKN07_08050 [Actinobaculum sp. 352]